MAYYDSQKANLPIFGVHEKLEIYTRAKDNVLINWSGNKGKMPAPECRLYKEDLHKEEQEEVKRSLAPLPSQELIEIGEDRLNYR